MRHINQGLESIGSATQFAAYVSGDYREAVLPLLASTTRDNYEYHLRKYLLSIFGECSLRDMSTMRLQKYFNHLKASHSTMVKIKDVLASIFGSAMKFHLLVQIRFKGYSCRPRAGKRAKTSARPRAVC